MFVGGLSEQGGTHGANMPPNDVVHNWVVVLQHIYTIQNLRVCEAHPRVCETVHMELRGQHFTATFLRCAH